MVYKISLGYRMKLLFFVEYNVVLITVFLT